MSIGKDNCATDQNSFFGMAFLALMLFANPTQATVLEYEEDGKVIVIEARKERPHTTVPGRSDTTALRDMARDVAIRYSGASGVRKAGLDALTFVDVFVALIERESAFDPTAISPNGAQGLGQLMPATVSDMGVASPFDPQANLEGSAEYLTLLLDRFGSLELALAAYNAGPERVKEHGGVPPFAQTRSYIDWIFKEAGIAGATVVPDKTSLPVQSLNTQQPSKGDLSVWEY